MQGGGGGGRKKQCGFIGAHKQAAGRGGYGRESRSPLVRAISFTPSFLLNIKSGPESLHTNQGGRGFTGRVSAPDGSVYIV